MSQKSNEALQSICAGAGMEAIRMGKPEVALVFGNAVFKLGQKQRDEGNSFERLCCSILAEILGKRGVS